MKKLAEGQEPVVTVPVIVKPVEVQVTLAIVAVEIANVAVAVNQSDRPNV